MALPCHDGTLTARAARQEPTAQAHGDRRVQAQAQRKQASVAQADGQRCAACPPGAFELVGVDPVAHGEHLASVGLLAPLAHATLTAAVLASRVTGLQAGSDAVASALGVSCGHTTARQPPQVPGRRLRAIVATVRTLANTMS